MQYACSMIYWILLRFFSHLLAHIRDQQQFHVLSISIWFVGIGREKYCMFHALYNLMVKHSVRIDFSPNDLEQSISNIAACIGLLIFQQVNQSIDFRIVLRDRCFKFIHVVFAGSRSVRQLELVLCKFALSLVDICCTLIDREKVTSIERFFFIFHSIYSLCFRFAHFICTSSYSLFIAMETDRRKRLSKCMEKPNVFVPKHIDQWRAHTKIKSQNSFPVPALLRLSVDKSQHGNLNNMMMSICLFS